MWCGIHKNAVVGHIFINRPLNLQRYMDLLQQVDEYLDYIPLVDHMSVIWQQYGSPPHCLDRFFVINTCLLDTSDISTMMLYLQLYILKFTK